MNSNNQNNILNAPYQSSSCIIIAKLDSTKDVNKNSNDNGNNLNKIKDANNMAPSTSKSTKNSSNNNPIKTKFYVKFEDKEVVPSLTSLNESESEFLIRPNALSNFFKILDKDNKKTQKNLFGSVLEDESSNQDKDELIDSYRKFLRETYQKYPDLNTKLPKNDSNIENPILESSIDFLSRVNDHYINNKFSERFEKVSKLVSSIHEILHDNGQLSDSFTLLNEVNNDTLFNVWKNLAIKQQKLQHNKNQPNSAKPEVKLDKRNKDISNNNNNNTNNEANEQFNYSLNLNCSSLSNLNIFDEPFDSVSNLFDKDFLNSICWENNKETFQPNSILNDIVINQDALDHVMNIHMNQNSQQQKNDKKSNYELELFEQNLKDLLASETGTITTISATSNHLNPNEDDELDLDENDEEQGELADDYYYGTNSDLSEWNFILSEPYYVSNAPSSPSQLSPQITGNKRKRFKTNNNQSISFPSSSSELDLAYLNNGITNKKLKRFYYKPYFIYKCQICSRKMNSFDPEHWLKHDAENHGKLFNFQQQATTDSKFVYQQINCSKNPSTSTGSNTLALTATTGVDSATATSGSTNSNNTNQISETYKSFTEFLKNFKSDSLITNLNDSDISFKLINCLICGVELKYTYIDILKHFQSEHEFKIFDFGLDLNDFELILALKMNNQLQLSEGVNLIRKCFIKIPPMLVNPSVPGSPNITKVDLIDKEIKLLNEIYIEQIVEKQIVSWLNSEQFLRRNFNYNSYVCIICNSSKMSILESHYNLKKGLKINNIATNNATCFDSGRLQYFTDEMKKVVLSNHILGHFNEYCYRCMSCKIPWLDITQLLKHAQECSNSQVVRTKTKYKLKANCRLQLKFYLQTYLDYWSHEKAIELKSIDSLIPSAQNVTTLAKTNSTPSVEQKLKCKVIMKDIFLNKNLLLDASSRFDLNKITLDDGRKIVLKSEEQETSMTGVPGAESVVNTSESGIEAEQDQEQEKIQENKSNDVQMRDESSEPTSLEQTTEKTE